MIEFLSLKKVNERHKQELLDATEKVIGSGWFILGEQVKKFEQEFAAYCGTEHCIGVANGLDALILILEAYKEMGLMQNGDEVIVPSNTYIASILAVSKAGLVPVLVEPCMDTYLLDPAAIEAKITARTKAILPVHLYGQLCDMEAINAIAKKLALTTNSLYRIVKEYSGTSPKDFLTNRLMIEAQRKLHYSNLSVKELAYELGFNDPDYFSRLFKKCTGKNVSEILENRQDLSRE